MRKWTKETAEKYIKQAKEKRLNILECSRLFKAS